MKIELHDKKVIFINNHNKTEIHPIWLRERVRDEKFLDKNNDQRLFDPSFLENISIEKAKINNDILELEFNDGVASKFEINKLTSEFLDSENILNTVKQEIWDIHPVMPIIEAAGGIISTWNNEDAIHAGNILVSANQTIHNKLLKLLRPALK